MWNGVVGGRGGWMVARAWVGLGGGGGGGGGCIGRTLQGAAIAVPVRAYGGLHGREIMGNRGA